MEQQSAAPVQIRETMPATVLRGGIELIDNLAFEWRCMCADTANDQPFFRPEWIRALASAFAADRKLCIVTAHGSDGLAGVLPLMPHLSMLDGLPVRMLSAVANAHSSRFDLVRRDGAEGDAATAAIWRELSGLSGWDVIECRYAPRDGALAGLCSLARADGCPVEYHELMQMPYIPLSGWDGNPDWWLHRVGRHFRHTFRTASRKVPHPETMRLRRIDTSDPATLERFYTLEKSGWKGDEQTAIGCASESRRFYDEVASSAARLGYFSMYFLETEGVLLAAHLGMALGGRYFAPKCAFDERYKECAPGHLIINAILRDCAARGLTEFEFTGPMSEWKAKWTTEARSHGVFYIFRNSVYGRLLHATSFRWAPALKHALTRRRAEPSAEISEARG